MKTAFYTFLGVLAAGLILFALYIGWQRLDRWEQGKNYWIAQFDHNQRAAEQLQLYLDNKPFGLPLTSTERKIRAGVISSARAAKTSVTTREDVSIQTTSGSVTIPKGSTLPFTYRNNSIVRIRYQNEDYEIPISLTDLE